MSGSSGCPDRAGSACRVALLAAAIGAGALLAAAPAHADSDGIRGSTGAPPATSSGTAVLARLTARPTPPAAGRRSLPASPKTAGAQHVTRPERGRSRTGLKVVDGILKGSAGRAPRWGTTSITVIDKPSAGGKITPLVPGDRGYKPGSFSYLPDASVLNSADKEQFSLLLTHDTAISLVLQKRPVTASWVVELRQVPVLGALLRPIIGFSRLSEFDSSMAAIPAGTPVAYTVMVTSFDGTPISTNFFPATTHGRNGVPVGEAAPTILFGPGLNSPGWTDPYGPTDWMMPLIVYPRDRGYNVITWDPRGMGSSGGVMHWDSPSYEGRDVSTILDWSQGTGATGQNNVFSAKVGSNFGMTGASYGGAIQLVTAAIDDRITAIVPVATWNSLPNSVYPDAAYKTAYDFVLRSTPVDPGITVIEKSGLAVAVGGVMSDTALAELAASGPPLNDVRTPTLLIQGTVDTLFPLQEAMATEQVLAANGVPVKSIWFCGGHGDCLDPPNHWWDRVALNDTMAWLDQYVKGAGMPADGVPAFQYVDQHGIFYRSDLLPTDPGFTTGFLTAHGTGGVLELVPFTGGSGPVVSPNGRPVTLPNAGGAPATNAVNVAIPRSAGILHIAGEPVLTFSYSGNGDSRFVYAQLVDDTTRRVVGNMVTPIPVTMDGQRHQVSIPMAAIAYTKYRRDSLTLQITSSATEFATIPQSGQISIANVTVSLPTTTAVTRQRRP